MWKDDAYILEIVEACAKAMRYVDSIDKSIFEADEMLHDAVMLQFVVIGESANK